MDAITDPTHQPAPSDINTHRHFWDSFGKQEKEVAAGAIVRLCQTLGGWYPFTLEQFEAALAGNDPSRIQRSTHTAGSTSVTFISHPAFNAGRRPFFGLDSDGYIVQDADGTYYVTEQFVARCYRSSPMVPAS